MSDRALAPYVCPVSRGHHRFKAVGDTYQCNLCALFMDPTVGYESPLGLVKREIDQEHPKVKAKGGWGARIQGVFNRAN